MSNYVYTINERRNYIRVEIDCLKELMPVKTRRLVFAPFCTTKSRMSGVALPRAFFFLYLCVKEKKISYIYFSSLHYHHIPSHLQELCVFVRVLYVVDHSSNSYFSLLLPDIGIKPYHALTLIRMTKAIIYNPIWYSEFRGELSKCLTG